MKIEQIRIQGLGPFRQEHAFYFNPDSTVIAGGNETGKTCLATAIFAALYGFPERSPFLNLDASPRVELSFAVESRKFSLVRSFLDSHVTLTETSDSAGEVLFEGSVEDSDQQEVYRTRLALILGTGEGTIWMGPGFVGDGKLPDRIDQVVDLWLSGKPQGKHETVLLSLKTNLADLNDNGSGTEGEIAVLEEDLAGKKDAQAEWQETAENLADLFERFREVRDREQEAEKAAEDGEEFLMNLVRFDNLTKERERLETSLSELRDDRDRMRKHIEDEEKAKARLEDEFSDFLDEPGDIEEEIQNWADGVNQHQAATRALVRQSSALGELPNKKTVRNGFVASVGMGILAGLAGLGAGAQALGFFLFPLFSITGFGIVWYMDRNHGQLATALHQEKLRLAGELEEVEDKIEKARRGLGVLGSYESPAVLKRKFRGFMDAQDKLERARGFTSGARPLSEVVEAYEQVFSELQGLDTETRDLVARASYLSGMDVSPQILSEKTLQAGQEGEEAAGEAREITREREHLEKELAELQAWGHHPGYLAEEIQLLEKQIEDKRQTVEELEIAIPVLADSVRGYQEGHLERVAGKASSYFQKLSQERYTELRLSDDLGLEVLQGEKWISFNCLGRGTYGQLLFALRLAIREEMDGNRSHPLILDEAFLGWDDDRLEQAREGIQAMTRAGHQVIVLSGDPRLSSWADRVIQLGNGDSKLKAA